MEPARTLSTRPVCTKKSKERITTCNATGEAKFPPLFIHKFDPIKNIDKSSLPVWYYWNKKRGCKAQSLTIILIE